MSGVRVSNIVTVLLLVTAIAIAAFTWSNVDALQTRVETLQKQTKDLEHKKAVFQSNLAVAQMALGDNAEVIKELGDQPSTCAKVIQFASTLSETDKTRLLNICQISNGDENRWQRTLLFFKAYNAATTARLLARNFQSVTNLYRQALQDGRCFTNGAAGVDKEWCVRALEGLSYSLMRRQKYSEAIQYLDEVRKRDSLFVFEGTTRIKTMCLSGASATQSEAALAALRKNYDANITANKRNSRYLCFAKMDRATIENDEELFDTCKQAHIQPMKNLQTAVSCN